MKKILTTLAFVFTFVPAFVYGADSSVPYLTDLLNGFGGLVFGSVPIIIGLAVVLFFFGLATYLFSTDDKNKAAAKTYIFWGIIILFVMTTVWGITKAFGDILGIQNVSAPRSPGIPTPGN